jgi:uroporphyrinogen decarboxylase
MTPRDIILANCARTDPPRPGLNFDNGRRDDLAVFWPHQAGLIPQRRWTEGGREYYDDEWGNVWVRMTEGSERGEIHAPLLEDWSRLDSMKLPAMDDPAWIQAMRDRFSAGGDRFRLAAIGCWVFDEARYMRKLEVYLMDLALGEERLTELHERVARVCEGRIRMAAAAGADGIFLLEDLGTQTGLLFSPAMFRHWFKDTYARLYGLAHELGMKVFLHSCGRNTEILDDLIECGVDCFQFDQPTLYDMPALAEKLARHRVMLWSPVDIQKVLPTGDHAYIREEARRLVRLFRGGLTLKCYPDLPGIGVKPEWDRWAYEAILEEIGE